MFQNSFMLCLKQSILVLRLIAFTLSEQLFLDQKCSINCRANNCFRSIDGIPVTNYEYAYDSVYFDCLLSLSGFNKFGVIILYMFKTWFG